MRGITLLLLDTAGIHTTEDTVERIGVERARAAAAEADLILWVVDSSAPLNEDDLAIVSSCAGKPMIALLNKSDLPSVTDAEALQKVLAEAAKGSGEGTFSEDGERTASDPIAISAKTGEGLEALEERITSMFFAERIAADDECIITSERHRQALLQAEDSLSRVEASIEAGMPEDFYSIDLTAA